MTLRKYLTLVLVFWCSVTAADEVSDLRELSRDSEQYREIAIDCLIEMKIREGKRWESEACETYKSFSKDELSQFRQQIKAKTQAFKSYSKTDQASKNRVKRGLKHLVIIGENMKSIKNISDQIKEFD